ncbi:MAG: vanadium-dependent haloperoxidase, partial [Pseudomonadota bacterium]
DNFAAGDTIPVSKALIGSVINEGFITQAEEVIEFSANLTDEQKIIAEFWEDGGGTAFPPGTWMAFAQFVSARDGNSLDEDAQLFFAMGNAVMDAGIATWEAKVFYDYARPVRAIRDLGELGLIGELGVDEVTGETGFVIEAFGGIDPATGLGRDTKTILAENFDTFQDPNGNPSPPFAEYTSGHSAFSAAGAEVLKLFTGSDDFGGAVTFAPGSTLFEVGVPEVETTLAWDSFSEAADEAGLSRLYGGIHFNEGDINGRTLGRDVGADAYDVAQRFIDGTATEEDRPFFTDDLVV